MCAAWPAPLPAENINRPEDPIQVNAGEFGGGGGEESRGQASFPEDLFLLTIGVFR